MALDNFRASIDGFTKDKILWWHILLWLFGLYVFVKMFSFSMGVSIPGVLLVPYSFNFVLHEFSHLFTAFLPALMTASSGSFSELLLGGGLVIGALWFRNYFALLFCLLWFDLALQSVGAYMADAVPQQIPLVSLGGALSGQDATHDWHFIFSQLHMLDASAFIGNSLRVTGHVVGFVGVVFAAWLIFKMIAARSTAKAQQSQPERPWEKPPTTTKSVYAEPTKGALAYHRPASTPDKTLEKHDNL